jgi:Kinesin motor domain
MLQLQCHVHSVQLLNPGALQVKSTKDCLKLLQQGDQNRVFASTEMNAHSSRSHAIVIVTVFKRRKRAITRNENGQEVTGQYDPLRVLPAHGTCVWGLAAVNWCLAVPGWPYAARAAEEPQHAACSHQQRVVQSNHDGPHVLG